MPSAFILSTVVFVLIMLLEHIIQPMKYVCIATMAMSGVDELTFKRMYKAIERHLPDIAEDYKHVGFIFAKSDQLEEEANG